MLDFVRSEFIAFKELPVSTHFAAAVKEKRLLRRDVLYKHNHTEFWGLF